MRFHLGTPPSAFVNAPGWAPLLEPSPSRLAWRGLLLGLCVAALVSGLLHVGGIRVSDQLASVRGLGPLAMFLLSIIGLLAVHEVVHALLHPGLGVSRLTVLGACTRPLVLYATYLGPMGRNRFVAILIAPFLLLSALPALMVAAGLFRGAVSPQLAVLAVVNAAASGVDLLGAALVLSQVPRGALVQNDGWQTYQSAPCRSPLNQA